MVSNVTALARVQPNSPKNLPIKLLYNVDGIGCNAKSIVGKFNYIREVTKVIVSGGKTDLVVCGLINMLPIAYFVARIKGAPLWCVIHGIDAWQPHKSILVNWIVLHVDGVLAVSELTKQRFIEWSGVSANKVRVLPNCYDPADFGIGPKPEDLVQRYGLKNKVVLLTLGRLVGFDRYKGFDEVLECLPALTEIIPNIVYLIVGDGDDKKRLQDKAKALGVSDSVIFAGYISELEKPSHYRLADAYVMPSRGEGFGIVYLEAMACGIPTVGSKLDGSREALRNGQLGVLVDPMDLNDIQKAILQALEQGRGNIPEGLDYFSIGAFRKRMFLHLKQIFKPYEIN